MTNERVPTVTADTPASRLVEPAIPVFPPSLSVGNILERIRSEPAANFPYIAACEAERLLGIAPAASLLRAPPATLLSELMTPAPASVVATDTAERVAWLAGHSGSAVIVVTDEAGRFLGLVLAQRLLPLLVSEHELDLAHLGGFLRGATRARTASEEPVLRRVWHRAPWLMVGLVGVVIAAQIVATFQGELESTLALAFFLPGIVYMADAVGTQTETLVMRGLSVGVSVRRMVGLETFTGALIGALLAVAIFPLVLALTGESRVAAVVSVSLLASTSVATLVAMSLPLLIDRLGFDPVFGSGPLATVMQDLLSILIYFGVAVAFLGT